jgi:hypothetical protein
MNSNVDKKKKNVKIEKEQTEKYKVRTISNEKTESQYPFRRFVCYARRQ